MGLCPTRHFMRFTSARDAESLTHSTWDVQQAGVPYESARGGRCIFTGRAFRAHTMVRQIVFSDGTEGYQPVDGAFGITHAEGNTWSSYAVFDMKLLDHFLAHPDMQRITLISRYGDPTTFTERRVDGSWLKHMAFRVTAKTFQRYARRSFAFSAGRVGGASWHDRAERMNALDARLNPLL